MTGSTPVDVMVRAMSEICDKPDIECMVICRDQDRKLSYYTNMIYISDNLNLLKVHELYQEEQFRSTVRVHKKEEE